MKVYTFDPHLFLRQVVLVGCGGTGSQLARAIARMIYSMKAARQSVPRVCFVDPDVVELPNVGRQLFTHAEAQAGLPKAEALARRFNYSLGLSIEWHNQAFDPRKHIERSSGTILLGAVDNHSARQALAQAREALWIDCGNHRNGGQVVIGNTGDHEAVLDNLKAVEGDGAKTSLSTLPNAALLYPDLLQPEAAKPEVEPNLSCAELALQGEQGVLINGFIASIAAEYLRKLLQREPISTYQSVFTGDVLAMRSTPITLANLRANLQPRPATPRTT